MGDERDILADIRAWRDEFARRHNYDLSAMGDTLRKRDAELAAAGWTVTSGTPRPPAYVPAVLPPLHLPGSHRPAAEPPQVA